ncbi:MAG TPA: hypothetical protein VNE86_06635 [Nitrososphaerales archaeon]|nr:hypothetical protein [Nitrososphaerales archaeon]
MSSIEEFQGLSSFNYGIQQGLAPYVQSGQTAILFGVSVWVIGMIGIAVNVRRSVETFAESK